MLLLIARHWISVVNVETTDCFHILSTKQTIKCYKEHFLQWRLQTFVHSYTYGKQARHTALCAHSCSVWNTKDPLSGHQGYDNMHVLHRFLDIPQQTADDCVGTGCSMAGTDVQTWLHWLTLDNQYQYHCNTADLKKEAKAIIVNIIQAYKEPCIIFIAH